jgi:hypothetical protein
MMHNDNASPECGLVSIRPLSSIRPHPDNDRLYRPVDPSDPDVRALADSIRQHGVKEPLVITTDGVVLSGHRRRVAAQVAGLKAVPVRVDPVHSSDPRCLTLLREYNRQRVKSLDEAAREEVVSANPEEAYRELIEYRQNAAQVSAETITIEGRKRRAKITKAKGPFLDAVRRVLAERRAFWPLTDRQIHYALLNDPPLTHASKPQSRYANTRPCYNQACELITRARLEGSLPFRAIHDPTRPVVRCDAYRSPAPFIQGQVDGFLKGYYRDLQQSQPNHVEIVGEKNTVESIIRTVAMEYCIPLTIGRGYCSLPPRYEMAQRFKASGKEKLVLLVLSDFDPEGEDIAHSFARSMRDDFGVKSIEPVKVALTAAQVAELQLPPQMKAKAGSSRRDKFTERHGDDVFELEAVQPAQLQAMLRQAIDGVIDIDAFNAEIEAERQDVAWLATIRRRIRGAMLGQVDLQPAA